MFADLRGFTELSETTEPKEVIAALDAWFDRVAGAVHAYGGEVLKFIGDGVLAIFPIGERDTAAACDTALRAVSATRAGMDHSIAPALRRACRLWRLARRCISARCSGGILALLTGWISPRWPRGEPCEPLEGLCRPLGHTVFSPAPSQPEQRSH